MDNRDDELLNGIIDSQNQGNNLEYNFNFESQVNSNVQPDNQPNLDYSSIQNPNSNSTPNNQPEVLNFEDSEVLSVSEDSQKMNTENIKDFNNDTDNLINPNLIVNPQIKQLEQEFEILEVNEPKVNYEKIKDNKKYAFMFTLFVIILLFIIFLPKIVSLIKI